GPEPETVADPSAPRRLRLFGRPQPPPRESRRGADAIKVEPRTDPAADAALKRRVESQIRTALGPRLRSLDVRVLDRNIHVLARPARFWQRRAVRRTIASLPALVGYRPTIEVLD